MNLPFSYMIVLKVLYVYDFRSVRFYPCPTFLVFTTPQVKFLQVLQNKRITDPGCIFDSELVCKMQFQKVLKGPCVWLWDGAPSQSESCILSLANHCLIDKALPTTLVTSLRVAARFCIPSKGQIELFTFPL